LRFVIFLWGPGLFSVFFDRLGDLHFSYQRID
jgi:hypothetical protein